MLARGSLSPSHHSARRPLLARCRPAPHPSAGDTRGLRNGCCEERPPEPCLPFPHFRISADKDIHSAAACMRCHERSRARVGHVGACGSQHWGSASGATHQSGRGSELFDCRGRPHARGRTSAQPFVGHRAERTTGELQAGARRGAGIEPDQPARHKTMSTIATGSRRGVSGLHACPPPGWHRRRQHCALRAT